MTLAEIIEKGPHWAMYNAVGRLAFAKAYRETTGKAVCMGCPADLYKSFFELKKLVESPTPIPAKKYTLLPGAVLQVRFGEVYTNETLTDAKAEKLLADYPHLKKHFAITEN